MRFLFGLRRSMLGVQAAVRDAFGVKPELSRRSAV
jgi:hypothetical protein